MMRLTWTQPGVVALFLSGVTAMMQQTPPCWQTARA
jgi:hypothetical protein